MELFLSFGLNTSRVLMDEGDLAHSSLLLQVNLPPNPRSASVRVEDAADRQSRRFRRRVTRIGGAPPPCPDLAEVANVQRIAVTHRVS